MFLRDSEESQYWVRVKKNRWENFTTTSSIRLLQIKKIDKNNLKKS